MAVVNWMSGFFWKLRWNLFLAAKKERRIAKMQRRARRKQDGLASQLEDLENRVMLSGTTAVNDQAVLTQVGVPVTLDVLSNDVSGNGALNIISATLTSGSGSVLVVDGDVNGTGPAARDRVQVTLSSNFTGNATIQYTIEDASGNQSTATATMSVSASLGSAFGGASGGGALTVSGGTGNGHVVTPTDRYLPTESGNYSYAITQTGATYNASGASGTQGITKAVTTTSNGVANWSYSELVTWVYDIYSNDGNGNTQHLWGGYSYTFSSVSVNGVITTTLAYVAADHYDNVKTTTTDTSIFENNSWGTVNTAITIINIDNVLDSGSIYYHNDSTTGSLGSGTYLRAMPGGSVSGTMNGDSYGFNTMTMNRYYTQQTTGGFALSGSVTMNGNGNNSFSYEGGGTYGDSSMMTTSEESGGQNESNSYNGSGTLSSLGAWILSGTGYTEGDQHSNFSYVGVGSYSREFHGGTMVGTQNTNGHNNSSGDFRIDYSLGSAGWEVTGGQNSAEGDSFGHFEYEGSGSYTFGQSSSGYSQTLSGEMSEDGHNTTQSNYNTAGTLDVPTMQWSYTGSGSGSGNNHDHMEYSGTGSYTRQIYGGTVSGSANEEYNHSTQGGFTTQSTLVSGEWAVTGSGSASGTSFNHTDFSGSGSYSRTEGEGSNQVTYSGTQKQDGHTTSDSSWSTVSSLAVTGIVTTNGSGSGTTDSHSYTYFSGSATYSRQTADGLGTISGSKNEEREDYQSNVADTQTTSFDQEYGGFGGASSSGSLGTGWSITTGSASADGRGFANTNWSGSGSYSKSWTEGSANYSGSVFTEEKGHAKSNYSASSKSTLTTQGEWFRTSGSGKSSGSNYDYAFTKSEGSYNKSSSGGTGYTSTYSGGYFNSNKVENNSQWNEGTSVVSGEFAQVSGGASGSGTTESISSNNGGGTYSYNGGAYNSHISGSVNEDRYSKDSTSYNTTSTWSAVGGWTTTGSMSADGNSRFHNDYSGTGRMNTISSMASGYNSSSGTTSLMGSVNENGHTNTFSKYSSTSTWSEGSASASGAPAASSDWKLESGSGSNWGDGYSHVDWDGSGSYSSSGSDNRWGDWTVSGSTTAKGHTNENNKWETSSSVQPAASGTENIWVTVSGSASDWGDSRNEKSHSGSGSWGAWVLDGSIVGMLLPNAYRVSGTVKQNGSDVDTEVWNTRSELDLSNSNSGASASGGESWKVISGSASATAHMDNRDEFGYSSANYQATGATWMSGSMSAYGFDQIVEDSNWKSVWSQTAQLPTENPEVFTTGPGWAIVSGSGRVDETSGSGKSYSGSGTYNASGNFSIYEGGGSWNFSASATQSGKVEDSSGLFVTTTFQNDEWVVDGAGLTASGFAEERWQWDGSGSYTRGTMQGSFAEGAQSYFKDSFSFEWASGGGSPVTADRDEVWNTSGYNNYSASGSANLLGVSGTYKEGTTGQWSSSGTVDYNWDTSLGEQHQQWIAASGSVRDFVTISGFIGFSGSNTGQSGSASSFSRRSFNNSFNTTTTENYSLVAQTASSASFPNGRPLQWQMASGNQTEGGNGSFDSYDESSGSYTTPAYQLSGSFVSTDTKHSDYDWSRTSTFSGNAWTTTGSGTKNANNETHFEFSGTANYTTNGGSGTRRESQEDNGSFSYNIQQTWVDQAGGGRPDGNGVVGPGGSRNQVGSGGGTSGYWSLTGEASGTRDGNWEIGYDQTEAWNPSVRNTALSGTQTTNYFENYSYSTESNYQLDTLNDSNAQNDIFKIISGGGSGEGNGDFTQTASASGAYSATFDSGQGVINGDANASKRVHWDYNYQQDLTLESASGGTKKWALSSSGSSNFDGFDNWDYAGSGSYDNTTTNPNGYSRTSASWEESAHSNYNYTGSDEWENNEWTYEWEKNRDAASDTTYTRYTEYDNTYTSNANGYNNWSRSSGHSNYEEQWHSESDSNETYIEEMAGGDLTWTHAGSGSNSSYHIIDTDSYGRSDWNNTYTSPNFTSFSNGYSSVSTDNYDRWDYWGTSSWEDHEDGSTFDSWSSGGSHDWNWSNSMNYSTAWGETTYYSSSGSGSGSGGSYSTGGSYAGGYTSGSSDSTGWGFSYSSSTPANPPGSGSGGPVGDGVVRWTANNIGLGGGGGNLDLPKASPPAVSLPGLGMATVAGFDKLGAETWRDLSNAEMFWDVVDSIEDAFAWAGDQVRELFDTAARWIEDAGVWASQTFGWSGFEVAGSFLAGLTRDAGDILGSMIDIPAQIHSLVDTLSNLTMEDVLDGIQGALDIVGMIPVVGEIADGINGVISLARGDYVGAALSFTSMIPVVGDAIGKGGKAARFIANKADDVLAAGRWIKCKVTGTGCFVAGTQVWISATAEDSPLELDVNSNEAFTSYKQLSGGDGHLAAETATLSPTKHTTQAIESVPIGSRVAGDSPEPWDYDDAFPEPDASTWKLATFSLQKQDGSWIDVEMIRPAEYWEAQEAVPGNYVYIEFPELEASGLAKIKSLEPCPTIASGTGNVVTARIVTRQVAELVELEFDNGETLTGTPMHPVWSLEREEWIELGDLEIGEHLWGDDGPVEILSTRLITTGESVYNIEVHGYHVYQVGDCGILVHNAGGVSAYKKIRRRSNGQFAKKPGPKSKKNLSSARQQAVRKAWRDEQKLAINKMKTTRQWSKAELAELKKTGKVKGYVGHHVNSVSSHPKLAGNPNNIEFVTPSEHLARHGGNFQNPTSGPLFNR